MGQIGKTQGCRVVGIAGGPEKCRHVVEDLGFDACVDYKSPLFRRTLKEACPKGIDIYFENVGGEIFDMVLPRMNNFGRIPICGMISMYNATELPDGPKNMVAVLSKRLTLRGFIVFDFAKRYKEAVDALGCWHSDGKLRLREDVRAGGVAAFPEMLNRLYSGQKMGKLVLRL